ncbi:MAG: hypothetical protein R2758_11305 [Bacteroidales bacterium]
MLRYHRTLPFGRPGFLKEITYQGRTPFWKNNLMSGRDYKALLFVSLSNPSSGCRDSTLLFGGLSLHSKVT